MSTIPLSHRFRPTELSQVSGQKHLISDSGLLHKIIEKQTPFSILLWGPPGCGKTTIASIYGKAFSNPFIPISAASGQSSDLKKILEEINKQPLFYKQPIIFIDELHRYSKSQQDQLLPFVENGSIILVGATTENPSFAINSALLSRLRVLTLSPLTSSDLSEIIDRFLQTNRHVVIDDSIRSFLIELSKGDARSLLHNLETLSFFDPKEISLEKLPSLLHTRAPSGDKKGDTHYNLISALHKSIRGSDHEGALYWLYRMLASGEDPEFILRRLVRVASEDIGLADPDALSRAISAWEAFSRLGSPEGELAIAQLTVYLALAPKSNALYEAAGAVRSIAEKTSELPPPLFLLNAPTSMMRSIGYGKGYLYDHDTPIGCSGQDYLPEQITREAWYQPKERGFERELIKRIEFFNKIRDTKDHD